MRFNKPNINLSENAKRYLAAGLSALLVCIVFLIVMSGENNAIAAVKNDKKVSRGDLVTSRNDISLIHPMMTSQPILLRGRNDPTLCLSRGDDGELKMTRCDTDVSGQIFQFKHKDGSVYTLVNSDSSQCLAIDRNTGKIELLPCSADSLTQSLSPFVPLATKSVLIRDDGFDHCVEPQGADVLVKGCVSSDHRRGFDVIPYPYKYKDSKQ